MSDHFHYLAGHVRADHEDLRQEAWVKALGRTEHRPNATTTQELIDNYQHVAGLVTHIYRHEKIKGYNRREVPLTDDMVMVYNRDNPLDSCTDAEREAISYYLSVIDQGRPLDDRERAKLGRYRKRTGLALRIPRYKKE